MKGKNRRSIVFGAIGLLFASGVLLARPAYNLQRGSEAHSVPGELLVTYNDNVSKSSMNAIAHFAGGTLVKTIGSSSRSLGLVKLNAGMSMDVAIELLRGSGAVKYVDKNFLRQPMYSPSDAKYGMLWGLSNTGQTSDGSYATNNPGTAGKDMDFEAGIDRLIAKDNRGLGGLDACAEIIVGVIDTGTNYNHADLTPNMWDGIAAGGANCSDGNTPSNHGCDFVDDDNDPLDDQGHGSHVSGTIAGADNSGGVLGVCPRAQIMALRVCGTSGCPDDAIIGAMDYAGANGAHIVNMSLGGPSSSTAMQTAMGDLMDANVVSVVAAGNDGWDNVSNPGYPCDYTTDESGAALTNHICVAALDQSYALADFSNWSSTTVHVGAPGTNVTSAWFDTNEIALGSSSTIDLAANWTAAGANGSEWTLLESGFACQWLTGAPGPFAFGALVNPANWCESSSGSYIANMDARIYRDFTGLPAGTLAMDVLALHDQEVGDTLRFGHMSGSGDPFAGSGTVVDIVATGATSIGDTLSANLTACTAGGACSMGFQMESDGSTEDFGPFLAYMEVLLDNGTGGFRTIDGTSMATPHVAGLAALVLAHEPNYTAADVAEVITSFGDAEASLAGFTTTGLAADAEKALAGVPSPGGLSAVQQ